MNVLPDKPSDLVRLALRDMEAAEASPFYVVDQDVWHRPPPPGLADGPCRVNSAGCVMAMTLGADRHKNLRPSDFDDNVRRKLLAVDFFRVGEVTYAFDQMGLGKPPIGFVDVCRYSDSANNFKRDQSFMIWMLAKAGF